MDIPRGCCVLLTTGRITAKIYAASFFMKTLWKFHRILMTVFATYPWTLPLFTKRWSVGFPRSYGAVILMDKLGIENEKILFTAHHLSHRRELLSSVYESGNLTVDGTANGQQRHLASGRKHITLTHEQQFPHSLGLLYSAFTAFLGFEVNDGEYKVMVWRRMGNQHIMTG